MTVFAFEGSVKNEGEYYLINKDNDTGTHSAYTQNSSSTDHLRGIRIRHTVTFNGVGNATPFYITIYGLSEEELPSSVCPTGVWPVSIPGFCYGGNLNCASTTLGHIVFIRSTNKDHSVSTDQLNHELYWKKIFLPYVEQVQHYNLRIDGWQAGDKVDNDHV